MSSIRANFAANLAGQAWVTLTQLLVVPLYIKLLGIEAYGLMGFFVALQATTQILDLGLGPTLMREIARRRASESGLAEARSLLKTLALAYLGLSTLIGLAVIAAAPFLATHVIHADKLSPQTVETAVMLMGLMIPIMWGSNLFNAALMGMERQVLVNALRVAGVTLGSLGAVLVLWLVAADVRAFFVWQLCAGSLTWAIAGWCAWQALPAGESSLRFDLLTQLWRFAAGMSAITIGGIVLMQLDKWLLIKLLPLETYGHYVLAAAVANVLNFVVTPLFSSIFPRFAVLHAGGDQGDLVRLYHAGAQYAAVLVIPAAILVALFAEPLLRLWTQNAVIAGSAAPIASILVCGTALNSLMIIPYAYQLATGNTWLALRLVLLVAALCVPAIVVLTLRFGVVGAATAWLSLNAIYLVVGITLTHRILLKGQAKAWIMEDVLRPAIAASAVCGLAFLLRPDGGSSVATALFIAFAGVVALVAAGLSTAAPRGWIKMQAAKHFSIWQTR